MKKSIVIKCDVPGCTETRQTARQRDDIIPKCEKHLREYRLKKSSKAHIRRRFGDRDPDELITKTCQTKGCQNTFQISIRKFSRTKFCPICKKTKRRKVSRDSAKKLRVIYKGVYKTKRVKSGRKCRRCGKDPWPNYFFCPGDCWNAAQSHAGNCDCYSVSGELYKSAGVSL